MTLERLAPHITQVRGLVFKKNDVIKVARKGFLPVLRANNITSKGLDEQSLIYIKREAISPSQMLQAGDILLASSSGSLKVIGKNISFEEDYEGSFGGFCKVVRAKATLDPMYLAHFFKSDYYRYSIKRQVQGANINNLKNRDIDDLKILVPSLTTQTHIAHLLRHCEQLIRWREESIGLMEEYVRSVFLEMFGDPATNPKELPVRALSDFFISPKKGTRTGPFGSALKRNEYVESGIPVWNMDNISLQGKLNHDVRLFITPEKYAALENYTTKPGDIIISRAGTVGKMATVDNKFEKAIFSTNLIRLRLNSSKLIPNYFVALMTHCKGRVGRLKVGPDGAFTHMNSGILEKLEFPYPDIDDQKKYLEIQKQVDTVIDDLNVSLTHLRNLYASYSQRAFRGELDPERLAKFAEAVTAPSSSTLHPASAPTSEGSNAAKKEGLRADNKSSATTMPQEVDNKVFAITKPTETRPTTKADWQQLLNAYPLESEYMKQVAKTLDFPPGIAYEDFRERLFQHLEAEDKPLKQVFTPPGVRLKKAEE
jgi:type I restriction enzyme S subunit